MGTCLPTSFSGSPSLDPPRTLGKKYSIAPPGNTHHLQPAPSLTASGPNSETREAGGRPQGCGGRPRIPQGWAGHPWGNCFPSELWSTQTDLQHFNPWRLVDGSQHTKTVASLVSTRGVRTCNSALLWRSLLLFTVKQTRQHGHRNSVCVSETHIWLFPP